MILEVKIIPYASKNEILRWEENRLVMKIKGVPERGKVNENLIAFLAKTLKIAKSRIQVISGQTARFKNLSIEGMSFQEAKELLSVKHS